MFEALPTLLQELKHPLLDEKKIQLFVKRDDTIHPEIMGNKWRKLKYNFIEAKEQGYTKLVTMGGAFSNHIAATASASKNFNFESIGIIRGDELSSQSNKTLERAQKNGMELLFISREAYKKSRESNSLIKQKFPQHYFVPEGGTNLLAIKGCSEIIHEIDISFDVIITPVGTGGTFLGLLEGLHTTQKVIGVSALKGDFIFDMVNSLIKRFDIDIHNKNYQIWSEYHGGGYAKTTAELTRFVHFFQSSFNITLDPVYTAKSFFACWEEIRKNTFSPNTKIVLLHTGGLQGNK